MVIASCTLSIAGLSAAVKKSRPHLTTKFHGKEVETLVDCGATITCVTQRFFDQVWGSWDLRKLPLPKHIRVAGITGHGIKIHDYVEVEVELLGKTVTRPVLVVSGLEHVDFLLGYDTISEEGLVIDGADNKVYFKKPTNNDKEWTVAALSTVRRVTLPARAATLVRLNPSLKHGSLPVGAVGLIQERPHQDLGIADSSIVEISQYGDVTVPLINMGERDLTLAPGDIVASMRNPEMSEEYFAPLTDEFLCSVLGDIGPDPETPKKGLVEHITPKEKEELLTAAKIDVTDMAQRKKYEALITQYHDVFSKTKFDLGHTDIIKHSIRMRHKEPVHVPQFRVPFTHEETIQDYVKQLLKQGAIEESRSPYNSPIFGVAKKEQENSPADHTRLRVVLDYRQLNEASMTDRYCIREIRECVDEVGRNQSAVFAALDLTAGFWQQALEEESRQYTAFTVPGMQARYQWKVTPMGLQGSPASFARLMDHVMRGITRVLTYIDDVLVHARSHEELLPKLEETFLRLRKYGLKLNVEKLIFGTSRLQYLGYTLTPEGVSVSDEKTRDMKQAAPPDTPLKIKSFVGVCNYFRFLIRDFSKLSAPLTELTSQHSGWRGGKLPERALEAFKTLKKKLTEYPVVAYPRRDLPFILRTDGSLGEAGKPGGLGAVLLQTHEDGNDRVVAYASRPLKQHEKNYSAFLIEQAAACYGIEHFDVYLRGRLFTLITDHKPMEKLSTTHKRTLNRLQQLMLEYDFTLAYKPGTSNQVADFLSRNAPMAAITATVADTPEEIKQAQKSDDDIGLLKKYISTGVLPTDPKKKAWVMRCAYKCWTDADQVLWYRSSREGYRTKDLLVTPKSLREAILKAAHVTREAGHGGEERTLDRVMSSYWWPGITVDVKKTVNTCQTCLAAKSKLPAPGTLQPIQINDAPNIRVHMDLFGPLKTGAAGNKYICVITDAFSKYTELAAIPTKDAETVAKCFFERWICRFSAPDMLITDQGKEFSNKVLEETCKLWGIKKMRTSSYHPQTNSAAERYNQTIINYMKTMLDNTTTLDWEELLPSLMMSYNMHVHASTKETPFFLTYMADPKLPYFDIQQPRTHYGETYAQSAFVRSQDAFKRAEENMKEAQEIREVYYAKKSKQRNFEPGDRVMVYFPNVPPTGVNPKFYKKWRFMYVVKRLGPLNLAVRAERKGAECIVHVDRVKHAQLEEIREHCDSALAAYGRGQDFYFERGERPRTRPIPPEEREVDSHEYIFRRSVANAPEISSGLNPNSGGHGRRGYSDSDVRGGPRAHGNNEDGSIQPPEDRRDRRHGDQAQGQGSRPGGQEIPGPAAARSGGHGLPSGSRRDYAGDEHQDRRHAQDDHVHGGRGGERAGDDQYGEEEHDQHVRHGPGDGSLHGNVGRLNSGSGEEGPLVQQGTADFGGDSQREGGERRQSADERAYEGGMDDSFQTADSTEERSSQSSEDGNSAWPNPWSILSRAVFSQPTIDPAVGQGGSSIITRGQRRRREREEEEAAAAAAAAAEQAAQPRRSSRTRHPPKRFQEDAR